MKEGTTLPWSIELYVDEENAEAIRAVSAPGTSPHVSLAVTASIDRVPLEAVLPDWATRQAPVPVTFDHWGLFLSESAVLFLAPREGAALAAVHRDFHRHASHLLVGEWDFYRPQRWVPHCTVADHAALTDLAAAVERARHLSLPMTALLSRMALVEVGHRRIEHWVVPLESSIDG